MPYLPHPTRAAPKRWQDFLFSSTATGGLSVLASSVGAVLIRQRHLLFNLHIRRQRGAAKSTPLCNKACTWVHLCKLSQKAQSALSMQRFLSTPAYPYLELACVVVVCGALSALLQRDEGETSEISRAGCQEDHCREDTECIHSIETLSSKEALHWHIRVAPPDAGSPRMMPSRKTAFLWASVQCGRVRAVNRGLASHLRII